MKPHSKLGMVAAAAALALAGGARAATFIDPWTTSTSGAISVTIGDDGLDVAGGSTSSVNGDSMHSYNSATGNFTDTFNFFLPTGFAGASAITTLSGQAVNDLNFSSITFNSVAGTTATGGGVSTAHVALQPVAAGGSQELVISGSGGPAATFGGTVSFVLRPTSAIPEPATWGLMIVGFGGIGGLLRRRRAPLAAV